MELSWHSTFGNINGYLPKTMKGYNEITMEGKTVQKHITVKLKKWPCFCSKTIHVYNDSYC